MLLNSFTKQVFKSRQNMSHNKYSNRNQLKLPEAHGIKALEIGSNCAYLRWAFLSTHSLTAQQIKALIFEIRTTDNSINTEFHFKSPPKHEFKARLNGLKPNTKYRFQIRCKLKYHEKVSYSLWSNRVEFETKQAKLYVTTDQRNLEIQSLKHQLNELQEKYNKLELENKELEIKLLQFQPPHHNWDYNKIVNWIMKIQNGLFKPYKQTLLENLKREEIDGKNLCQIDINDLNSFGITKFAHKKILMSHLHQLTKHDKIPEYQYDHELAQNIHTPSSILLRPQKSRLSEDEDQDEDQDENEDEQKESPKFFPKVSANKHFGAPTPPTPPTPPPPTSLSEGYTKSSDDSHNSNYQKHKTLSKQKHICNDDQIITPSLTLDDVNNLSAGIPQSVKDMLISSPSTEQAKKWKYKNGVLSIKVLCATNVDNMDEDDFSEANRGASDPYVELELKGHYKKEKTKVIYNDANPVWNERFQLFPENPKKDILKCKIWDKDTWTFDDKIGSVYIPVIDVLNANGYIHKPYDIKGSKTGAQLHLELKYKELEH